MKSLLKGEEYELLRNTFSSIIAKPPHFKPILCSDLVTNKSENSLKFLRKTIDEKCTSWESKPLFLLTAEPESIDFSNPFIKPVLKKLVTIIDKIKLPPFWSTTEHVLSVFYAKTPNPFKEKKTTEQQTASRNITLTDISASPSKYITRKLNKWKTLRPPVIPFNKSYFTFKHPIITNNIS